MEDLILSTLLFIVGLGLLMAPRCPQAVKRKQLESYTVKELRKLAARYGIKYYSRMSKQQLLRQLSFV